MIVVVVVVGFASVIFFFSSGVLDLLAVGLLVNLGLGVVICADFDVVVELWVWL